jgi:CRP/FNR family transcriptional regulator
MATGGQYASVPAGTFLYHEGDHTEQFALVGTGSIRVFKTDSAGHEITLYHVQDGQACLVNMLTIFLERPAMATAVVEVATEAVVIPAAKFRDWVDAEQTMRKFVFESMATRLIDVMVLAQELAFRRMDQRLGQWLLDRFSSQHEPRKVIVTTHEEIAKELGSVREVVSRLLKVLERNGAIGTARGHIELLNEELLKKLIK